MVQIKYSEIAEKTIAELQALVERRDKLNSEIIKKEQFLGAVINMLDEEDERYGAWVAVYEMHHSGLTDAIRQILQSSKEWFSAAQMRDALLGMNFDFTRYKTNPLASVHAVLRRMKPNEAETSEIEGTRVWKWKGIRRFPRRKR